LLDSPNDAAELLRLGENVINREADAPVVVRIARSVDRLGQVEKELCVAMWLAPAGVRTVRVPEDIDQPQGPWAGPRDLRPGQRGPMSLALGSPPEAR